MALPAPRGDQEEEADADPEALPHDGEAAVDLGAMTAGEGMQEGDSASELQVPTRGS